MNPDQDYRRGLSAEELVSTLQSLLAAERTAMRLTCRYLADLADCMEAAEEALHGRDGACLALIGYADVYHAAECLFGLGAHSTRERIRVGRALRSLPRIEDALVSGELSYSRAREVTRVATADDESEWLDLARTLPMRTLERRVVEATGKASPARTADPAQLRWSTPETVEVTLRLPAEAWALLQRAMEGARRASEASLSEAEALAAVARDALERQNTGADTTDPRHTVVLYECQSCLRTEVDTGAGPLEIGAGAAAALGCGARVRDLRTEGRVVSRGGPLPRAIERAVREGDAEGDLRFHDETGAPLSLAVASHSGTSAGPVASHGGTAAVAGAGEEAATLLALMGSRGGWSVDALVEASGLHVGAVQHALLGLELDGRVECDAFGSYTPWTMPEPHPPLRARPVRASCGRGATPLYSG